ncbi:hypothetical protein ACFSQU_07970 [Massilia sp. GCM10020059]|uniref:Uncharacterized protein n=1 Tax=Massilia agrisoli TaxID=2892444 RepID=A0ABS8IUS7_9BURK|nr:hypothetical protein [Massilia agrisoli]MCC6072369.1 hypothetical protein [Massilia agrisoli]
MREMLAAAIPSASIANDSQDSVFFAFLKKRMQGKSKLGDLMKTAP